jgi:Flp pilus assembly protein TadD
MRRELGVCLLLLSVTLAVYWQIGDHQFTNYDDTLYVTENPHVQRGLAGESVTWAFTATGEANWHPLTWLSHMVDCQLFGLRPGTHHLTSLFFHLANTVLLFATLHLMTGALWRPAFVAALFALHPLHVESVAWVAERKDVLSTLFWLLAMVAYTRYVGRPTRARYVVTLVAFGLGLMAKSMPVTLPFVLLLLDYWPLDRTALGRGESDPPKRRRKRIRPSEQRLPLSRLLWEKTPFFALAAISSVVTFSLQQRAGAMGDTEVFPLSSRIANALISYIRYIGKMIWPSDLAVLYPHPGTNLPLWCAAGAGLAILGLSVLVVLVSRRRPYLAVGWFWYVGTLVPVIGLIQVGVQAYADRYTYVPLIGLFIMIAWGVPDLLGGWAHARTVLAVLAAAALAALAARTWTQLRYWKDSVSLFTHTLQVTTNNYVAQNNLGNALADRGRVEEAISHYTEALRIKPDHAEAYNNWGTILVEQGRLEEAVDRFLMALRAKPDYAAARSNLGLALARKGQREQAIAQYLEALRLDPAYAKAHNNLALVLAEGGQWAEAIAHYREALRLKPDYAEAHNNLGHLLVGLARLDEAATQFAEAVRSKPDYARACNNLGIVLARLGRLDEAVTQFREALRIKPDYGEAQNNLAVVLARMNSSSGNSNSRGVP